MNPPDMMCTSLHQPWASLIAAGIKRCETRRTPMFRNQIGRRVGIAATKQEPDHDKVFGDVTIAQWRLGDYGDPDATFGWEISRRRVLAFARASARPTWDVVESDVPFGALVATVVVGDVVEMVAEDDLTDRTPRIVVNDDVCYYVNGSTITDLSSERDYGYYEPGRFGILLGAPVPVNPPTPISGAQGIWTLQSGLDRQAAAERKNR